MNATNTHFIEKVKKRGRNVSKKRFANIKIVSLTLLI
jgi:hypothetical protein